MHLATALASAAWNIHDTRLIAVTLIGIAIIVGLIVFAKMHPFLSLMLGSAFVGFAAGVPSGKVVTNFETGVGSTLQEVGLLIALGAMLGKLMADSGGADRVIDTLLAKTKKAVVPWAMTLAAVIIGLPMFFEIGLVLLVPVIVLVAQRSGHRLMRVAIPALAALSALHGLVPPHPGPLIAISALHARLGITLALGILVAIPTAVICGPLLGILVARWVPVWAPSMAGGIDTTTPHHPTELSGSGSGAPRAAGDSGAATPVAHSTTTVAEKTGTPREGVIRQPSFLVTVLTVICPVVLMLLKALGDIIWDVQHPPEIRQVFDFIGEPLVAMTVAVLLAMITFGYAVGFSGPDIASRIARSVGPIAAVILIVGAGGGFKQTLIGAGVGDSVAKFADGAHISLLVLGWLIAVVLRLATGSATVATITAAGIVAPLAGHLSPAHTALLVLAIGTGSVFLSHVNDAGFWLVKELFGLSVGQTFKSWSLMETAVSCVGFGFVMLLSAFV